MKRTILFAVLVIFAAAELIGNAPAVFSSLSVSASSAVLINADTGEVLFGKDEKVKRPMASTTKIMTALLALSEKNLDEKFTVDPTAIKVEGTSMGLREGDSVSLYELACGMLMSSGNDAANAAAVRVAGSMESFVALMNQKAAEIGLANTSFATPSGLDAENHYSTAYDMALLGAVSLENGIFKSICSSKSVSVCFGTPEIKRTLYNHNKLLTYGEEYIGIKTGYTKKAGRCLVSAKEVSGVTLIAVTLNAKDDWNDHVKLYDYGFSGLTKMLSEERKLSVAVVGGESSSVKASVPSQEVYYVGAEPTVNLMVPQFVYAPVSEGDIIGKEVFSVSGKTVCEIPIYAENGVEAKTSNLSFWEKVKNFFRRIFKRE